MAIVPTPPHKRAVDITSHDGNRSTRPEICDDTATPSEKPRNATPASPAERPSTDWSRIIEVKITVDVPMLPTVPAAVIRSNSRILNSDRSINGKRTRRSTATKTTIPARPATMRAIVAGAVHPQSDA